MQSAEVKTVLHVKLQPHEIVERAKTASQLSGELIEVEGAFKLVAAEWKDRIKKLKAKQASAAEAHNTGLEYREVDCVQFFDEEKQRTWYVYEDQRYGERAMNPQETRECNRMFKDEAPQIPGVKLVDADVQDVVREESKRTKKDHLA